MTGAQDQPARDPGHDPGRDPRRIANFLFIPYYPVWSVVLIAVDLLIIWALLSPRREWA